MSRIEELFDIVNDRDEVIGTADRTVCHGNPALIHRAVHIFVWNRSGKVLLQLRSRDKLIQPSRWDTSVGGHVLSGESYKEAAIREMQEELGLPVSLTLTRLFDGKIRNEIESENTRVYTAVWDGPFEHDRNEIEEIRFWSAPEVASSLGTGVFTPSLEQEFRFLKERNIFF